MLFDPSMSSLLQTARVLLILLVAPALVAQQADPLISAGWIDRPSGAVRYQIRHLPIISYPSLPAAVSTTLEDLRCTIPQTYQAHGPENVIHASFENPGSSDWAVLCSRQGTVSLLVFFGSAQGRYAELASSPETDRLQPHIGTVTWGFNWGIDPASPETVHQAQIGMKPRPAYLKHDAIADSVLDQRTVYRYYSAGSWSLVDLP